MLRDSAGRIWIAGEMRDEDRQTNGQMAIWLSLIADTSRGMVDSMSDLVWAINPEKDRLDDLTQRMHRHCSAGHRSRDGGRRRRQ